MRRWLSQTVDTWHQSMGGSCRTRLQFPENYIGHASGRHVAAKIADWVCNKERTNKSTQRRQRRGKSDDVLGGVHRGMSHTLRKEAASVDQEELDDNNTTGRPTRPETDQGLGRRLGMPSLTKFEAELKRIFEKASWTSVARPSASPEQGRATIDFTL